MTKRIRSRRCETCRHWDATAQGSPLTDGRCRQPHTSMQHVSGVWSRNWTHRNFGCVCWTEKATDTGGGNG